MTSCCSVFDLHIKLNIICHEYPKVSDTGFCFMMVLGGFCSDNPFLKHSNFSLLWYKLLFSSAQNKCSEVVAVINLSLEFC